MTEVVGAIRRVTDLVGEITAASAEQSEGVSQVADAITQMDTATAERRAGGEALQRPTACSASPAIWCRPWHVFAPPVARNGRLRWPRWPVPPAAPRSAAAPAIPVSVSAEAPAPQRAQAGLPSGPTPVRATSARRRSRLPRQPRPLRTTSGSSSNAFRTAPLRPAALRASMSEWPQSRPFLHPMPPPRCMGFLWAGLEGALCLLFCGAGRLCRPALGAGRAGCCGSLLARSLH
jgi:hypothetical protein